MTHLVKFTTTAITHEGCARSINEDSHLTRDEAGLWAVADGMGGHEAGEVASGMIVDALGATAFDGDMGARLGQLEQALTTVNQAIFLAGREAGAQMGSTVVALLICGMQFACVWAGDSRIYRLREGVLTQLTRDHTSVQDMLERGLLSPEEAHHHPFSHVVSRGVGIEEGLETEIRMDALEPRDIFLLCSDGLTGVVSDDEIASHLTNGRRAACRSLLDLTLERGAPDNVTIVTIACEEKTALMLQPEL